MGKKAWTEDEKEQIALAYLAGGTEAAIACGVDRSPSAIANMLHNLREEGRLSKASYTPPSTAPAIAERATPAAYAPHLSPVPVELEKLPWIKWPSGNRESLEQIVHEVKNAKARAAEVGASAATAFFADNLAYAEALLIRLAQQSERVAT